MHNKSNITHMKNAMENYVGLRIRYKSCTFETLVGVTIKSCVFVHIEGYFSKHWGVYSISIFNVSILLVLEWCLPVL